MRTIDADALYRKVKAECNPYGKPSIGWEDGQRMLEWIEHAPTVATDTNVLGKWIRLTGMAPPEYHGHKICSVCESFASYDPLHPWREMLSPYCPGCGAKMEVKWDAQTD